MYIVTVAPEPGASSKDDPKSSVKLLVKTSSGKYEFIDQEKVIIGRDNIPIYSMGEANKIIDFIQSDGNTFIPDNEKMRLEKVLVADLISPTKVGY